MPTHIALLRAVNVGGTGKLPMAELRLLCEKAGFENVRTYIQSGNVVFESKLPEARVKAALEAALAQKMGKPHGVLVRSRVELERVLERNPFPAAPANRVVVFFLDEAPEPGSLDGWPIPGREQLVLSGREIFIHYPDGQGKSKLVVPFARRATGRSLATVAKLAAMAAG